MVEEFPAGFGHVAAGLIEGLQAGGVLLFLDSDFRIGFF
jgi:hypothetical protein